MTAKKVSRLKLHVAHGGNTKDDAERLVLPGIVFAKRNNTDSKVVSRGFILMVGWWKWGIGFTYVEGWAK